MDNDANKKPDPYANLKDKLVFAREEVPSSSLKLGTRGVKLDAGLPDPLNLLSSGK